MAVVIMFLKNFGPFLPTVGSKRIMRGDLVIAHRAQKQLITPSETVTHEDVLRFCQSDFDSSWRRLTADGFA